MLTKLLMPCFSVGLVMPSHATVEVWCYFEQYKWLEAFTMPAANNMEAIWASIGLQ